MEPFGEQRKDTRTAILICYIVNWLGRPKRQLEPADILPFLEQESAPAMTTEDERDRRGIALERKFSHYVGLHNARVATEGSHGV